jgi:large subunit ribosomal protein L53
LTTAIEPLTNAPAAQHDVKMITKYMTEVTAKFNPFSPCAKPARLFLTFLPPKARANGTAISTTLLPRNSPETSSVQVKFKDGKQMSFDCQKYSIQGLVEEVDRHSRQLQKASDLTD